MEFVCELTEKFSSCKMLDMSASKISEECSFYSAKEGLIEKMFLRKNVSAISQLPGRMSIVAAKN